MKGYPYVAFLSVALAAAACSSGPADESGTEQPTQLPELTLTVDSALTPQHDALPAFGDGAPRPVASITGDDGTSAEFVANELWVSADSPSEAEALAARLNGTILKTIDASHYGLDGLPSQYLIRVDPPAAEADALRRDLSSLNDITTGDYKVSSQDGLDLIAAGSHEASKGLRVGFNWVGRGEGQFTDKSSLEAPNGTPLGGINYNQNAFGWPSHNVASVQDIGVAEAWRALDLAGKLGNKVKIGVLDMGFQPDSDWAPGWLAISNVPLTNPIGTGNLLSCSGGSPCPWHGTQVVSSAMALPDNNYGAAGSAGPIATPVVVFTLYDFFTSMTALGEARLAGAKIANMSYGAPVPWYVSWSVLPFEATTAAFRATGMLLFAAAGNEGKNVDGEGCTLGVCWERTWYTPCENAGVICVGGLGANSTARASGSNYGHEHVDIFAPYTLWLGPDPDEPDNKVRVKNGTSFSSPFAAGVAALIWAANPNLGANGVEELLMETAHTSPDTKVRRYVNAYGAVQQALGNIPPAIEVVIPKDGAELPLNLMLTFEAKVDDFEDASCCGDVTWTTDVDGVIGHGTRIEHAFKTVGPRMLSVTTQDSLGAVTTATAGFTIINAAPTVSISKPLSGEEAFRNSPLVLRGTSFDLNEPGNKLACDKLVWTSSVAADPLPVTGCEVQVVFPTNGPRTLTLTGTDPQGASGSASVGVSVLEPPPNLPPSVTISSPMDHAQLPFDQPITLAGSAIDPEGATNLTYEWTAKLGSHDPVVLGNSATVQWTPTDTITFNSEGTYTVQLRLTVKDPEGNAGTDFVVLEWLVLF